ncbi:MAG: hypothetical protein PHO56_00635 [Patescibacteria group bacterium]|nr:hypothetical protein [Patescibacteria group bacterium]
MKKIWLVLILPVFACLLFVCSNGNPASPLSDNYDQSQLFNVQLMELLPNGFAKVEVHWLVQKLGRGNNPFSFGPQDFAWSSSDLHSLSQKTADGKYYFYQAIVQIGNRYDVGGGLSWSGSNISNYRWLTPSEQGLCPYYNPDNRIMSFTVYGNGVISPGRGY